MGEWGGVDCLLSEDPALCFLPVEERFCSLINWQCQFPTLQRMCRAPRGAGVGTPSPSSHLTAASSLFFSPPFFDFFFLCFQHCKCFVLPAISKSEISHPDRLGTRKFGCRRYLRADRQMINTFDCDGTLLVIQIITLNICIISLNKGQTVLCVPSTQTRQTFANQDKPVTRFTKWNYCNIWDI